jgi:hypothetical protein
MALTKLPPADLKSKNQTLRAAFENNRSNQTPILAAGLPARRGYQPEARFRR